MCKTWEGNEHVQGNSEVFSLVCMRNFDCALAIMSKPVLVTQQLADHAAVTSSCSTRPFVPCITGLTEIHYVCFAPYGFALRMNKSGTPLCRLALSPHRRSTSFSQLRSLLTLLVHTLSQQLSILVGSILRGLCSPSLQCDAMTLVLDALWGDETLDLWGFGVWFGSLLLGHDFSSNDELAVVCVSIAPVAILYLYILPNIILLVETEELANLGGALGTETLWVDDISQAWDVFIALLNDREGENGEILCDDAATD
jgi:hypothetical protein